MNKTNLRQLKRNLHGVSVVIGALMLTLIVVTAAASFAIFTAQKQEELQEQEFANLLIESEQIAIIGIENIKYNLSSYNLSDVSFVVSNQHLRESKITGLSINDLVFRRFHIEREDSTKETWNFSRGKFRLNTYVANTSNSEWYLFIDNNLNKKFDNDKDDIYNPDFNKTGTKESELSTSSNDWIWLYAEDKSGNPYLFKDDDSNNSYTENEQNISLSDTDATPESNDVGTAYPVNDKLKLQSMERIRILLNDIDSYFSNVFFKPKNIDNITKNNPIKFNIRTSLTNTFEKIFLPPTPNIEIRREQDSILLDGSNSFCEDDANIIEWEWNLTKLNPDPEVYLPIMYGPEINANRILTEDSGVFDFERHDVTWNITLTVKNNYGMLGIFNVTYIQDFRESMTNDEDLELMDVLPTYYGAQSNVVSVNITIRSNSKYSSNITDFWINNKLNTTDMNISCYDDNFTNITVDSIPQQQPITIKIKTALGNTFEKTFYPPNPVIRIQTESLPTGGDDYYILDGSLSDHPGDGYIVSWKWNVTNTSDNGNLDYLEPEPVGRKAMIDSSFINATEDYKYRVNLTVIDNFNMIGKSSFIFKP